MDDFQKWIGPIITIVTAACSLAACLAVLKLKTEYQQKGQEKLEVTTEANIVELRLEVKEAVRLLNDTVTQIKVVVAEQAVLNKMTTHTLTGITNQMRTHEKEINEIKTSIGVFREVLRMIDGKLDKIHED